MTTYKPAEKVDMNGNGDDDDDGDDEGTLTAKLLLELSDRIMSLEKEVKSSRTTCEEEMQGDCSDTTSIMSSGLGSTASSNIVHVLDNDTEVDINSAHDISKEFSIDISTLVKDEQNKKQEHSKSHTLTLTENGEAKMDISQPLSGDPNNTLVIATRAVHELEPLENESTPDSKKSVTTQKYKSNDHVAEKKNNMLLANKLPNDAIVCSTTDTDTFEKNKFPVVPLNRMEGNTSAKLMRSMSMRKLKNKKKANKNKYENELKTSFSMNILR
jgi:hypothetical protein